MKECKLLKVQQDIADAFNNYFSSIDKISKNDVDNKINGENLSTFHCYLEKKNTFIPYYLWFLKLLEPKNYIYNYITKNKKFS